MNKVTVVSALLLSTIVGGGALAFSDVDLNHPQKTSIEYLEDVGVIKGYNDGTFKPEDEVNRAEMTKILLEALEIKPDAASNKNCFPDVTDQWFAPYICYAKSHDILSGYSDGTFKPDNAINTVEALKIMFNTNKIVVPTPVELTTKWYEPYLQTAAEKRFLEKSKIDPKSSMTRGDVSDLFFRLLVTKESNKSIYTPKDARDVLKHKTNKDVKIDEIPKIEKSFSTEKQSLIGKLLIEINATNKSFDKNTALKKIEELRNETNELMFWEDLEFLYADFEKYYKKGENKKDFSLIEEYERDYEAEERKGHRYENYERESISENEKKMDERSENLEKNKIKYQQERAEKEEFKDEGKELEKHDRNDLEEVEEHREEDDGDDD